MRSIGSVVVVAAFAASTALASKPVLRVNGDEITDLEVKMAERAVSSQMPPGQASEDVLLRHAVDQLIGRTLVLQAAREAKIVVDPKDVAAALEQQKAQLGGADAFAKAIAQAGLTEPQLTQMEHDRMMLQKYVETELAGKAGASDQEIRAYYDSHPAEFKHPEQIKLRMILVMVKQDAAQAQQDAAKVRADQALKRIKGGEDFAKVAGEASDDPSKARGGEIGWVRKGLLLADLEPTVWALKAGEVSPVLHSQYGYHVFKVEERRAEGTLGYDEVKESLATYVRNRKLDDSIRLLIVSRRSKAKIEALDPSVKAALEPPAAPPAAAGGPSAPAAKPAAPEKPTPAPDAPRKP